MLCQKAENDLEVQEVSAYINEPKRGKWKTRNKSWRSMSNGTSNSRNDSNRSLDRSSRWTTPRKWSIPISKDWVKNKKKPNFEDVVSKMPVRETPRVMNLKNIHNSRSNSKRRKSRVTPLFKNVQQDNWPRENVLSQLKRKVKKGNSS